MVEISNFFGVIVAAIAKIAICMFWYSPKVFGKLLQKLSGMQADKEKMPVAFVGMTLMAVITASILTCFAVRMHVNTLYSGAMLGAMAWLGFSFPVYLSDYLWAKTSVQLVILNSLCDFVALVAMGAIIAFL